MSGDSDARSGRIVGVDTARALASLIMVQGHAYHAWVAEPYRDSASYQFTRLLGSLPLPAFLLLAGVGMGLRARAAVRRGQSASSVRAALLRRGVQVLLAGYLTSFAFALLDGTDRLTTLLRADVLHVIGLSIATMALLGVRGDANGSLRLPHLRRAAWGLAVVPSLLCPWLSPLGTRVPGWAAPVAALVVDVPSYTRMPLVPLVAWLAAGVLLGTSPTVLPLGTTTRFERRAGARPSGALTLALCAAGVAALAHTATGWLVDASSVPLDRAHPAVLPNILDGAARGSAVLALGLLLGGRLPAAAGRFMARLGQSSLWIYVAHLPFCYGRPGKPLFHALDMTTATLWLLPLMGASVGVGLWRSRLRTPGSQRQPVPAPHLPSSG